jgi:hypothetical protein
MWWGATKEDALAFCAKRSPQPDEQFLADCGLADDPRAARVALAVRRSVAGYGLVDPLFIRAGDRYPEDLVVLPGWDSLDLMAWFWMFEEELGAGRLPVDELMPPVEPFYSHSFSVKDLVTAAWEYLKTRSID